MNVNKDLNKWENPFVVGENKMPARNLALPLDLRNVNSNLKSSYKLLLDGTWKFYWQKGVNNIPFGFEKPDFDDFFWDSVDVPCVWQASGFGKPIYLCNSYPAPVSTLKWNIPSISHKKNEIGLYRKQFVLPENFKKRRVIIHFGAAKSALYLYINGKYVGFSKGSMTPSEFDITNYVDSGLNLIAVKVFRYSDATYLEDQDMWMLSGIYRSVYIISEPLVTIDDFYAEASLSEDYKDGVLTVSGIVNNSSESRYYIKAALNKKIVYEEEVKNDKFSFKYVVRNVKKWSAESPDLYSLCLYLYNDNGFVVKKFSNIGFKKVEIDGNVFMINGQPVKLKGVNRHDFNPETGWALTEDLYLKDIILLKNANINAVRTSHYPDDIVFYDLCDKYGIYVLDECDLETHGVRRKNVPGDNPIWEKAVVDRAQRMVLRDRSRACVCIWSLGNEAGDGTNYLVMKREILKLCSMYPVHYEGDFDFTKSDFISRMYPSQKLVEKLKNKSGVKINIFDNLINSLAADNKPIKESDYDSHPVIYCEYAHCMENSLGNFKELVSDFEENKHMCGGFIWDFVDQSLVDKTSPGNLLYGGDFNEGKTSYYFCANGIVGSDRIPHPSYYEVKQVYSNVSARMINQKTFTVSVINKNYFISLDYCYLNWKVMRNGVSVQSGTESLDTVLPQTEKSITLPVVIPHEPGEYYLTLSFLRKNSDDIFNKDDEISFKQFYLKKITEKNDCVGKIVVNENNGNCRVSVGNTSLIVEDKKIVSLDFGTGNIFGGSYSLKPDLFRALTDNDRNVFNFAPYLRYLNPLYFWFLSSELAKCIKLSLEYSESKVIISQKWCAPFVPVLNMILSVNCDGTVDISGEFDTVFLPVLKTGVTFNINKKYGKVTWYGRGPYECYCDRNSGQKIGLYSSDVGLLSHNYMRPQENGNRTENRYVIFTDKNGKGFKIESTDPFDFGSHLYSVKTLEKSEHIKDLKFDDFITLNIDSRVRGVGGDLPGLACLHGRYKLQSGRYYFNCKFSEI